MYTEPGFCGAGITFMDTRPGFCGAGVTVMYTEPGFCGAIKTRLQVLARRSSD